MHYVLVASRDPNALELPEGGWTDLEIVVDTSGSGIVDRLREIPNVSLLVLDMAETDRSLAALLRYVSRVRHIPTLLLYDGRLHGKVSGTKWLPKPLTHSALLRHLSSLNGADDAGANRASPSENGPSPPEQAVLQSGPLKLNRKSYQFFIDDTEIHLPMKEFMLLAYMFEHRGQVLTREQLHLAVWKHDGFFDPNSLTAYVKNIRRKLGPYKACIRTVWGVGYQFAGIGE